MKITIGLSQMNSQDNKAENLAAAQQSIAELAENGANLIMLPEHFDYIGPDDRKRDQAEPIASSPGLEMIRSQSRQLGVHIHIGSCLEKDGDQVYNTGLVFDPQGEIIAKYRKIHLFDVEIPGGKKYLESETITAGNDIVTFAIGEVIFGMATCYDLRFPELFRRLSDLGADVLLLPAAFTLQTGKDHWELLLRARAVENLCWVAAAAQWGEAPPKHLSYGRSMVINPWGIVTAQAPDGVSTITAQLDMEMLHDIRLRFPARNHIRKDIF